ncbi:hypothetical protein [Chryseobacterium sp. T1]
MEVASFVEKEVMRSLSRGFLKRYSGQPDATIACEAKEMENCGGLPK